MNAHAPDVTTSTDDTVILPREATIGAVEETLEEFALRTDSAVDRLYLDLSNCTYIEAGTLLELIALMVLRKRSDQQTQLRLPRSKRVRDFLRVWRFPSAISEVLDQPFIDVVHLEDQHYFGENVGAQRVDVHYASRLLDRLESTGFFAITSFRANEASRRERIVLDESNRWKGAMIRAVLTQHLGGTADRLSSHVVYEALSNSFRHPDASVVLTTSHFMRPNPRVSQHASFFTITFWDDGEGIVRTLRRALDAGLPIRADRQIQVYARYRLTVEDHRSRRSYPRLITSDFLPDGGTPDPELLLAALLPGVTRDVEGKDRFIDAELYAINPAFTLPGMGLYVLTHAIVDIYGGTVAIRSGPFFLNVKRALSRRKGFPPEYAVKVRVAPAVVPDFGGNMITVRIPLSANTTLP